MYVIPYRGSRSDVHTRFDNGRRVDERRSAHTPTPFMTDTQLSCSSDR